MGALGCYDAKFQQAKKEPPPTKRGRFRKRLATIVLDNYLKEAQDTMAAENLEKLASKDSKDRPSMVNLARIQKRILDTRRKKPDKIFHKGRTLCKLIQMTHLRLLFDPDIWYV